MSHTFVHAKWIARTRE